MDLSHCTHPVAGLSLVSHGLAGLLTPVVNFPVVIFPVTIPVTERVLAPAPRVVPATFLLPPLIPRPPPLHAEL